MTEMSAAEAEVVARFDAAEAAPESWRGDDGLREAIDRALFRSGADNYDMALDLVLALPEVAALRAKAAAADRVRELAESWTRYPQSPEDRERNRYGAAMQDCGDHLRRALDGPPKC